MKKYSLALLLPGTVLVLLVSGRCCFCQEGNKFTFAQLHYSGGNWDPYPTAYKEVLHYLDLTTSIKVEPERKQVSLCDPDLFSFPFLYMAGQGEFGTFSPIERENLKRYLEAGGILFIDDCSGSNDFSFDHAIRRELEGMIPESRLTKLTEDHVIFRSFYLAPQVRGRCVRSQYLEGLDINGSTAVIYSHNDMLGAWARDRLGNWLNECIPGGEGQRLEAMKLFINIIVYSMTGTYKTDAVHQPFIQEKLKARQPAP